MCEEICEKSCIHVLDSAKRRRSDTKEREEKKRKEEAMRLNFIDLGAEGQVWVVVLLLESHAMQLFALLSLQFANARVWWFVGCGIKECRVDFDLWFESAP